MKRTETQEERNEKIIRAVKEKAEAVCPGSLDLIGINGSFVTGQQHARSDLDLLIVIGDGAGERLSVTFVEDEFEAAHDLYCYTWDRLRETARYENPHIAKLLDSKIVYSAGKEYTDALEEIRQEARARLLSPFGPEDYAKAEKYLKEAEHCFVMMQTAETLSGIRQWSADLISCVEDGITMLNKQYYRLGVKARYGELEALANKPDDLCRRIEAVAAAADGEAVRNAGAELMKAVLAVFHKTRQAMDAPKKVPGPGDLEGTYEEMVSNWRGKMHLAAETGNRHLALESLGAFRWMLIEEIGGEYAIGEYDVMAVYDPEDLPKTAAGFDALLRRYRDVCEQAGVRIRQYPDTDAFLRDYLGDAGGGTRPDPGSGG